MSTYEQRLLELRENQQRECLGIISRERHRVLPPGEDRLAFIRLLTDLYCRWPMPCGISL
jgi:hypothetical protein